MNNISSKDFNSIYPRINSFILSNGLESDSRNGKVKKLREFVTRVEPEFNMVGGWQRNINPFFLFVEAVWIWLGRGDVAPLIPFNSRMKDYSDDGKTFHAPYGYRLRNHFHMDQISDVIEMLSEDKTSRRAVMQIWDASCDLDFNTKDIPCNDMITVCIGELGELRLSIFNRSNDLHWGLPTNIYQFSFIGKLIANCLNVPYGQQTHFSNDLHCYLDNPIVERMEANYNDWEGMFTGFESIYDYCKPIDIKFDFKEEWEPFGKLNYIDSTLKHYFSFIEQSLDTASFVNLRSNTYFSSGLNFMFAASLLYKETKITNDLGGKEEQNIYNIRNLISLSDHYKQSHTDFSLLAVNFFASKLKDKTVLPSILENYDCDSRVKEFIGYL